MTNWLCTWEGCTETAVARVGTPPPVFGALPGLGYAIVYPVASRAATGMPYCADHVHCTVDAALMAARPPIGDGR